MAARCAGGHLPDSRGVRETKAEIDKLFGPAVLQLVLEVTDDKSLPKEERKRLQIETTSGKSREARLLKIADKTSNVLAVAVNRPVGWDRRASPITSNGPRRWSHRAAALNAELEKAFDVATSAARAHILATDPLFDRLFSDSRKRRRTMPTRISRAAYADMFGPTTGDKVRLADTDLIVEVEKDLTTYGEEVKFGGGKVIRDGMGQSQVSRADGAVDTVITNALIVDHTGIYKADVGLRDGRIAGIGKAGNPDVQPGVTIIVGPGTEAIAGEGKILTAGGFDAHIHFICPQQIEEALYSGLTMMLGGGTGPATGTDGHHLHARPLAPRRA